MDLHFKFVTNYLGRPVLGCGCRSAILMYSPSEPKGRSCASPGRRASGGLNFCGFHIGRVGVESLIGLAKDQLPSTAQNGVRPPEVLSALARSLHRLAPGPERAPQHPGRCLRTSPRGSISCRCIRRTFAQTLRSHRRRSQSPPQGQLRNKLRRRLRFPLRIPAAHHGLCLPRPA